MPEDGAPGALLDPKEGCMSPVDDTVDGIVLRWPKPVSQSKAKTIQRTPH